MNNSNVEKIVLRAFKGKKFSTISGTFYIPINPEQYTRDLKIKHNDKQGQGNQGTDPKFQQTEPEKLKLDFFLDGTNTVEGNLYKDKSVTEQVEDFLTTAHYMDSESHKPKFLKISWKDFHFECLLESVSINYTLFDRTGDPLRAKISATFLQYIEQEKRSKKEDKRSPDLTRIHLIKEHEKLPLLAFEGYNKIQPYMELARINGLTNFRDLTVGSSLIMPPFDKNEV